MNGNFIAVAVASTFDLLDAGRKQRHDEIFVGRKIVEWPYHLETAGDAKFHALVGHHVGDVFPLEVDAPRSWLHKTSNQINQRCLPRTIGANDAQRAALF